MISEIQAIRKRLETLSEEEIARAYRKVFEGDNGALVLEDLRNRCYYRMTTSDPNPAVSNVREGMRTVVLHIETMISPEPEQPKTTTTEEDTQ